MRQAGPTAREVLDPLQAQRHTHHRLKQPPPQTAPQMALVAPPCPHPVLLERSHLGIVLCLHVGHQFPLGPDLRRNSRG